MKKLNTITVLILSILTITCKKSHTTDPDENVKAIVPDFSWQGSQIAPAELTFTNLTQNASAYRWDFSNGTNSNLETPNKVQFTDPGAYTVTLTATKGESKVFTSKVILIAANENPIASFSYAFKNKISYAPATVQFVNESVNATTYEWEINGRKDYFRTPTDVTFAVPGNYSAKLTAIKGTTRSTVFEEIIAIAANPNPIAKFQIGRIGSGFGFYVGQDIQLINQSTNCDSYTWNLGNNQPKTSTEEFPLVRLTTPGINTFTLTGKRGTLTHTYSLNINVQP
jgi:PKD repeat protein